MVKKMGKCEVCFMATHRAVGRVLSRRSRTPPCISSLATLHFIQVCHKHIIGLHCLNCVKCSMRIHSKCKDAAMPQCQAAGTTLQ